MRSPSDQGTEGGALIPGMTSGVQEEDQPVILRAIVDVWPCIDVVVCVVAHVHPIVSNQLLRNRAGSTRCDFVLVLQQIYPAATSTVIQSTVRGATSFRRWLVRLMRRAAAL